MTKIDIRYRTRQPDGSMMTRVVDFRTRRVIDDMTFVHLVSEDDTQPSVFQPPPPKKKMPQKKKKRTCGIHKWLGIRWHGYPWPLRWQLLGGWPTYCPRDMKTGRVYSGCGCIVKLKAIAVGVKSVWNA